MRKHFSNILKFAITILGLTLVLRQVDFNELWLILLQTRLSWMLVGFLLVNASLVVRAFRWFILLRGLGIPIRFSRLVEIYFIGNFFNAFLPSGFGGDVVRVVEVSQDVPASTAAGTVILDRLTGLIMLFIMAILIIPWQPDNFPPTLLWIIIAGAAAGFAGVLALRHLGLIRRWGSWLPGPLAPNGDTPVARLLNAVQGCGWRAMAGASAVSLLFNLILASWWLTSGLALDQTVPFSYYILIMPILSVPLLIPSVSGLGPRELLAPTLFAVVGITPEAAVSISFLVFIITRLAGLLGAPIYVYTTMRGTRDGSHPSAETP